MGCKGGCGGEVVAPKTSKKIAETLPRVSANDELFIQYIVPGTSSLRTTGVTDTNYYFVGSPRNRRLFAIVNEDREIDTQKEVYAADAAEFVKLTNGQYHSFKWVVVPGVAEADAKTVIADEDEEKEPVSSIINISDLSISDAEALIKDLDAVQIRELLENELADRGRKGMVALLEKHVSTDVN